MLSEEQDEGAPAPVATPSFTLGEFIAEAGRAIRQNLPKQVWVEAVILEAKANKSGLALELVEAFADARANAFLRCVVFARAKATIEAEIGLSLDVATLKGVHARLMLKPAWHPRYHLEGEVIGIDPAIVESLVARRTENIRRILRAENLYGSQATLQTPDEITSVAVIHPDKSAGWADVQAELARLQDRRILTFKSYPALFEGGTAATGIVRALADIQADMAVTKSDIILIVRGGGASVGLAALADLALARAVCRCPIPIVTGLGHASDKTLLDEVAWRAADTPSKALGVLKAILRKRCQTAVEHHRIIVDAMDRRVTQTLKPLLAAWSGALVDAAANITANQAATVRARAHAVERHVIAFRGEIAATQRELDRLAVQLIMTAPQVPRTAKRESSALYSGIVRASRARLPRVECLTDALARPATVITDLLNRQSDQLRASVNALESAMRRRLGDEAGRLANAFAAVQALDATSTLKRGFALPLDEGRRIIRSASEARVASSFELLFTDGAVACRPVSYL